MPGVRPFDCASWATLSALDCEVADSMMIVHPVPPVHPGKLPLPVVVGLAVALGNGVLVAPGDGVVVAPGEVVAVGNGVAVGTGDVVGAGAAAEGVGVGVP